MAKKVNMTVTSRFFAEATPIATHEIPSPLPPNDVGTRIRLSGTAPTQKLNYTYADLARTITAVKNKNCVFVPDTNFFTTPMDDRVWEALLKQHVLITPAVWNELRHWMATPYHNTIVRDLVAQAERDQAVEKQYVDELLFPVRQALNIPCYRRIEILSTVHAAYKAHGFHYYFNLLALRKWMGPAAMALLEQRHGRTPTDDEFLAEIQGRYGERGFLIAKKGRDNATSPNLLTDEQLVVMAVQTGIIRGAEVILLTRDADVLEQFQKLMVLMKEHYRCMHMADRYAANPASMAFQKTPVRNDGAFEGDSMLVWNTTESEADRLPHVFHPIDISCVLIGGERNNLKMTFTTFFAESEMARLLRVKTQTGGLSTDQLEGNNCYIETGPLSSDQYFAKVYIGKEKRLKVGPAECLESDATNAMQCNERITRWKNPQE